MGLALEQVLEPELAQEWEQVLELGQVWELAQEQVLVQVEPAWVQAEPAWVQAVLESVLVVAVGGQVLV